MSVLTACWSQRGIAARCSASKARLHCWRGVAALQASGRTTLHDRRRCLQTSLLQIPRSKLGGLRPVAEQPAACLGSPFQRRPTLRFAPRAAFGYGRTPLCARRINGINSSSPLAGTGLSVCRFVGIPAVGLSFGHQSSATNGAPTPSSLPSGRWVVCKPRARRTKAFPGRRGPFRALYEAIW